MNEVATDRRDVSVAARACDGLRRDRHDARYPRIGRTAMATKAPANDRRDIKEVWIEYKKNKTEPLRNILMENYLHLVRYNAERIHVKLPDEVELDDLMSAGIFGLMDAIAAFDLERGVKFETYCAPRIRGAILDELRSMDWVPRLVRSPRPQARRRQQAARSRARPRPDQRRGRQAAEGPDGRVREDGQGRQRRRPGVAVAASGSRPTATRTSARSTCWRTSAAPTRSARSSART